MKDGPQKTLEGEAESAAKQATKETSRYNETKEKTATERTCFSDIFCIFTEYFIKTKRESVQTCRTAIIAFTKMHDLENYIRARHKFNSYQHKKT